MLRTHTCGELRIEHADQTVSLAGWVHSIRSHGGVSFIDLRDRYGITQVVVTEHVDVLRESVLQVSGVVAVKPEPNKALKTGEVEVKASSFTVLSSAEVLPLDDNANEDTLLKYRYLQLRRPELQQRLLFRHKAAQLSRQFFSERGFVEVETPLLMKSTPEGARDYVVPSRVNKGLFYALPQSPQIYKQLLMVGGVDKYFQIAKCLRDEDLRKDRQPEFTQLDIEMSFVEQEDLLSTWEEYIAFIVSELTGKKVSTPLLRLPYAEAIEKYGLDRPDTRFEMFLTTITDLAHTTDFNVFKNAECVRCLVSPKQFSRKEIAELEAFVKTHHAKGLAYTSVTDSGLDGGVAKFLDGIADEIISRTGAKPGDMLFFGADSAKIVNDSLGFLRLKLGAELELVNPDELAFCFVVDFPLFEKNDEGAWEPAHHMFCQPLPEFVDKVESDPGSVLCTQYDIVLNGVELASGSIRIIDPKLQSQVFSVIGITEKEVEEKFGFMLEAFTYGAPPHGGVGIGFDRIVAMLQGLSDIRDVIAFPKNKRAQNPMDGSPGRVSKEQLDELGLSLK